MIKKADGLDVATAFIRVLETNIAKVGAVQRSDLLVSRNNLCGNRVESLI